MVNERPIRSRNWRAWALLLVLVTIFGFTALGGMYLTSFATHFVWLAVTGAHPKSVEDFPVWLFIPPTAITLSLMWLAFYVLHRLRIPQRIVGHVNNLDS